MSGNRLIYTVTRGTGTSLIRNAIVEGITFQFNTGHGFYRPHTDANGIVTDLRTTNLTPDDIETEISYDVLAFLASGGSLPQPGSGFAGPLQRTVTINNYQIAYRTVQVNSTTICVSTYFLIP